MGKINRDNFSRKFNEEIDSFSTGTSIPLRNVTGLTISTANDKVAIMWKDPANLTTVSESGTTVMLSEWEGTKVIYKKGSAPTSLKDGVLVIDSKERDAYETTGLLIEDLEVGVTYYFMVIPYNTVNEHMIKEANTVHAAIEFDKLGDAEFTNCVNDEGHVTINWKDPEDVIKIFNGNSITTAEWAGTKIVRKVGSAPVDVNDGVLVIDSKIRNAYSEIGFIDPSLIDNTTYFYRAFPYTTTDVVTNGAFVSIQVEKSIPGPKDIAKGNTTAGFYGEVSSEEFITGDRLALRVGLSNGISQYSDTPWLKFIVDGKILFTPKKPIRYNISWDQLNAVNLITGNKTIQIGENYYKVRLWRGVKGNEIETGTADNGAIGSEWNRLMLPIHNEAPDKWLIGNNLDSTFGGTTEDWGADFTNQDLIVLTGNGSHTWCQEYVGSTGSRLIRGDNGITSVSWTPSDSVGNDYGWRPVLELALPGFEDKFNTPGPSKTIARGETAGFFGEVPSTQFISGDQLATEMGLTDGTSQFSDTPWLKFIIDGKILFTPKKSIRNNISWNMLNTLGLVEGSRTVKIGNNTFKVRLWQGAKTNPANNNADRFIGSEWNRLMLPIHIDAPNNWKIDGVVNTTFGGVTEDWGINYTDEDLLTYKDYNNSKGTQTIFQESREENSFEKLLRGYSGITSIAWLTGSQGSGALGWRPVLELVLPMEDISGSPGAVKTIARSENAGFFGEVPATELITGDALATAVGLTSGTSQYSDTTWLKFVIDGKIIFTPKKPIRHSVSWNHLNTANVVNGNKIIKIGNHSYKVRLFKGVKGDSMPVAASDRGAIGSEWNRLMLPIHAQAPSGWTLNGAPNKSYGGTSDSWWINYTDDELGTYMKVNGTAAWCQEKTDDGSGKSIYRGYNGISDLSISDPTSVSVNYGWRPVLELIPPFKDTSGSPGLSYTITQGTTAGFFGEVPASELITGDSLATAVGLTDGVPMYTDTNWLKFIIDGKILFTPKKPIRNTISWEQLNGIGLISGDKVIKIGNHSYRVRLFKGVNGDAMPNTTDLGAIGSEWNRLMLPIHVEAPNGWKISGTVNTKFGGVTADWGIDYTDGDLVINYYSICQELSYQGANITSRGYGGISASNYIGIYTANSSYAWRPVLELIPSPYKDDSGSPGPSVTVARDATAGFFGEVPSSDLVSGAQLASMVGLTEGTVINSDTNWLKFMIDGNIVFVPKKPIRNSVSWNKLNAADIVTGNKKVKIGSNIYKVRLFKGVKGTQVESTITGLGCIGSEWNRLLLPIHIDAPNAWKVNGASNTTYAGVTEDWNKDYTDTDLGLDGPSLQWCQEAYNATDKVARGSSGITSISSTAPTIVSSNTTWRPILELVRTV